jgi:methylthioribose-1-phosphate isomerase
MQLPTLQWIGGEDGYLELLDQTLLPRECKVIACHDVESLWEAIKALRIRGAPAIGIAAAYGVCLGLQQSHESTTEFFVRLEQVVSYLATSRPTAVNLFWALDHAGPGGNFACSGRCAVVAPGTSCGSSCDP